MCALSPATAPAPEETHRVSPVTLCLKNTLPLEVGCAHTPSKQRLHLLNEGSMKPKDVNAMQSCGKTDLTAFGLSSKFSRSNLSVGSHLATKSLSSGTTTVSAILDSRHRSPLVTEKNVSRLQIRWRCKRWGEMHWTACRRRRARHHSSNEGRQVRKQHGIQDGVKPSLLSPTRYSLLS